MKNSYEDIIKKKKQKSNIKEFQNLSEKHLLNCWFGNRMQELKEDRDRIWKREEDKR